MECGGCGDFYHPNCWLPGCERGPCTNEYDYRVRTESIAEARPRVVVRPKRRGPQWKVSSREEVEVGLVVFEGRTTVETLGSWPDDKQASSRTLVGVGVGLFFLSAIFAEDPKHHGPWPFFGWLMAVAGLSIPVLRRASHLGQSFRLLVTNAGLCAEIGQEGELSFEIPRAAAPTLERRFLKPGFELRWAGFPWRKRLVLGPLSALQEEALRLWIERGATPELELKVLAASGPKTCPLCHDSVVSVSRSERGECSSCGARYHASCWDEFGGCALPSCRGLDKREAALGSLVPEG